MKTVTRPVGFRHYGERVQSPYGLNDVHDPIFIAEVFKTSSVTYGDNKPNWRSLIAAGSDATTSLSATGYKYRSTPGEYHQIAVYRPGKIPFIGGASPGVYDNVWGLHDPALSFPSSDPGILSELVATNKAKVRFAERRTAVNQKFTGGVFLGELRETLHLIRKPAKALRAHVDSYFITLNKRVKRIRTSGVASLRRAAKRKVVADTWLEYAFGMRPLISDTRSAAEALASLAVARPEHQRVTAVGEETIVTFHGTGLRNVSVANWLAPATTKTHVKFIIRGSVRADPQAHTLMSSTLWGFDPVQWIPTAWELLPYSFLADYFLNVGAVLQSWASLSIGLEWCNATLIKEIVNSYGPGSWVKPLDHPDYFIYPAGQVPTAESSRRSVTRIPGYADFIPRLAFQLPGFGTKWINLAALLSSKRKTPFY